MNSKIVTLLFGVSFILSSCHSDRIKKEARGKALEFFSILKKEDEKELARLYPGFSKLEQYYKSDSGAIISTTEVNGIVIIGIENRYTNKLGKLNEKKVYLYYKVDSLGHVSLFDSKGLTDFSDNDAFKFGSKTGCVDRSTDTTDQQIILKIKKAREVMMDKAISVYLELKKSVRVVNWSWESGYGGSASGHGIVRNLSSYSIPKLKYKVTYNDYLGNEITSDDGYVTYETLESGESKSFTFYTSYVGGASRASIEMIFDDKMIFKYLSKKGWSGNECQEYVKNHPDTLRQ